jgi:hypothetical protein
MYTGASPGASMTAPGGGADRCGQFAPRLGCGVSASEGFEDKVAACLEGGVTDAPGEGLRGASQRQRRHVEIEHFLSTGAGQCQLRGVRDTPSEQQRDTDHARNLPPRIHRY